MNIDNDIQLPRRGWMIGWTLLVLAAPVIASMISRTVMSFVDFIMVSQLGTEAQAAIMPAGILLFCVISFGIGLLSVINTFVAQSLGSGRLDDCSAYAWQGLWLSLAIAAALLPAWYVIPPLFHAIGHAPRVQEMEIVYVQIGILGLFPMMGSVALSNFFTGIHKPMVGFWAAFISNLFNAVANYALIFGNFGFPPLGMAGAAWATQLAALIQMLILLGWLLRPVAARLYGSRHTWRPSLWRLRRIVWFGLPAGFQFTIDIVAFTIFTLLLIGRFGTVQLAANNLAFKFLEISFMPLVGLSIALTAAVGKAIGQQQFHLARKVTHWAAGMGLVYTGLIAVAYLALRHPMVELLTDDPDVARWAANILVLCAVFQIFDAINMIHIGALRGAGDNHVPAMISAICVSVIFLGGAWLAIRFVPQFGSLGPWTAATAYIAVLGLGFWARWTWGPWEKIDLIDRSAAAQDAAQDAEATTHP